MKRWRSQTEQFDLEAELHALALDTAFRLRARTRRGHFASARGLRPLRSPGGRLGLAVALTGLMIVAIASFGGLGYASSPAKQAAKKVEMVAPTQGHGPARRHLGRFRPVQELRASEAGRTAAERGYRRDEARCGEASGGACAGEGDGSRSPGSRFGCRPRWVSCSSQPGSRFARSAGAEARRHRGSKSQMTQICKAVLEICCKLT
jgi:hypothetical protein